MTISVQEEALLCADQFRFAVKCETIDSLGNITDVTASVVAINITHTEIAESIFGFQMSVSGKSYDRAVYATGNRFRVYRELFDIDGFPQELYYEGYILPGSVQVNWNSQLWELSAVDRLTYLSNRGAPIISVSELNVAEGASVEADSYTTAETVAGQNEFIGKPLLDPSKAVDNDIGSLWVSAKAPTFEVAVISDAPPHPTVSEVYGWPHQILDKKSYQWLELCRLDAAEDASVIRLMTRSGIIELNVTFGEQYGTAENSRGEKPQFAVTCYDAATMSSAWGEAPRHCPVFEWKNAPIPTDPASTDYGRVGGRNWGFNLDEEGDYIAIVENQPPEGQRLKGHNDIRWRTVFVENGADMTRIDQDVTYGGFVGSSDDGLIIETFNLSSSITKDEYAGCFVQLGALVPLAEPYGQMLYISRNDTSGALSGGRYPTRFYCTQYWDAFHYPSGTACQVTPWPNGIRDGSNWPDSVGLDAPTATVSYKQVEYNEPRGVAKWEQDSSPQVGFSGVSADDLWSWITIEPTEMSFLLSSPIATNDVDVYLESTIGLPSSGFVYIALNGPYAYSGRTYEKITLDAAYPAENLPAGTQVYEAVDGSANTFWPVKKVRVYRRKVPYAGIGGQAGRVINSIWLYGTNDPSPRPPGTPDTDGDWREDWDRLAVKDNNTTQSIIEWDCDQNPYADPWWRYRKYCLAIRSMIDNSQGRINEVYMLPPDDITGDVLENARVDTFFEYILGLMGLEEWEIDVSGASQDQLSQFSTDPSKYLAVLSDMAVRTGTVIVAEPTGSVTATRNPYWPDSPIMDAETIMENPDIQTFTVQSRDDRSISQVQVTVMDGDGNMTTGRFPPVPRQDGEVYIEQRIFSSQTGNADTIARWLFFQKVAPTVSIVVSGAAPWAISGKQLIGVYWTGNTQGVDVNRYWHVLSAEQDIRFGSRDNQAIWKTTLSLRDARQWQ